MSHSTPTRASERGSGARTPARLIRRTATLLVLAAAAIAAGLWGVAMPVRDLPAPTGPHAVGSIVYDLTDATRRDPYALESPAPARTIRLQLWYPTADPPARRRDALPWVPEGRSLIRAIVTTHGFPAFVWDHTTLMRTSSVEGAPVIDASADGAPDDPRLPVVLISHGWEGWRALHTDIAEELASHGYLVAAPDHTYGAAATQLADGTILRSRDDVLPEREATDRFGEFAAALVATFTADNAAILGHLERVAAGTATQGPADDLSPFAGRIDPQRVALVGHSTGGGAMVGLALADPRIDALVGLDAWVEPLGEERLSAPYSVPSLFLRSEAWEGGINDGYLIPFVDRAAEARLWQIDGITHVQMSTLYMYEPAAAWLGLLGTTDGAEYGQFQRTVVRSFIDHELRGVPFDTPTAPFVDVRR